VISETSPNGVAQNPLPGWGWYFVALLTINLLPIWVFPFFPSQDGPAHLDSAVALRALASADTFFQGYYESNWRIATNQVYHLLLIGLGNFLPILIAEKLVLSFYVATLPMAMLFAVRQLQPANPVVVFLVFPVIYSYILQMGFYNYCLGLIVFLLAIGLYLRFTRAPTAINSIILSGALLVTYFIHLVVAASALLAIASMAVARLLSGSLRLWQQPRIQSTGLLRLRWKESGLLALSALPVILVAIAFLSSTAALSAGDDESLFTLVTESPPRLAIDPRPLRALTIFSMVDLAISLPWALLLFSLAGISLVKRIRRHDDDQYGFLSFAPVVFLVLILTIPKEIGPMHYLFDRFLPYFYFLLILWLAVKPLTPFIWCHAAVVGIALSTASVAYRLPIHAELNQDIAEFISAATCIEDNSTILPIVLGKSVFSGLGEMRPRVRFDHLKHAAGYIALQRRIINLGNYQGYRGYFPIRFRDEVNPHLLLFGQGGDFEVDFDAYETTTQRQVDYVLLWGPVDEERYQTRVGPLLEEMARRYTLTYVSKPRGLMRVYRSNAHSSLRHSQKGECAPEI
jgi:uncharacterized membrane protein